MESILNHLVSTLAALVLAWLLMTKIPSWLGLRGSVATILRIVGVVIIIIAVITWI